MRRALLPALLLFAIDGNAPRPKPVLIDTALVEHLRTLEDWAAQFERTDAVPLPAMAQWESCPPELLPPVLDLCAPFYSEFDALWNDPVSRAHLQSGLLSRHDNPRMMGTRECLNLLAARAIHAGHDLGDSEACQRDCEQLLAYAHSLGTDDIGFMLGWMGEGILKSALQKLACAGGAPGVEPASLQVPIGIEQVIPHVRETYARHSSELRALAAR